MADDSQTVSESQPETEPTPPTQAQLYDDLRRIGQLEDQKHAIQCEIDERTERLRQAIPTLDPNSLLYKMLASSLGRTAMKTKTKKAAQKKTTKKRTARRN